MSHVIDANRLRQLLLIIIISLIGIVLFNELRSFVPAVLGATTLYVLLRSTYFSIIDKRKWRKSGASLLLMLLSLFIILLPIAMLVQMLSGKVAYALEHSGELVISLKQLVADFEQRYSIVILSQDTIDKIGAWLAGLLPKILGATFNSLSTIFFMYFILYFMFVNAREMEKTLQLYLPFRSDNVGLLEREVHSMVVANAVGIPVVALVQGIVGLVGYLAIGVKEPFFWFGITCIAGVLPVIGAALAYIPLIIIFLANGQLWQGVAMFIFGFGVIGTVDNVMRFSLLRKIGDVHPLITVFGVIAGVSLFGFIGLIFGPLLISLLLLLIRIYRNEFVAKSGTH